ncbi:tektin-2 isoform X1 [Ictalurus punctatus]|uniref:Tektin n=1 Tax=Ictalurus punctatus TaxID=7998 RepID=A0A2D0S1J4_ICTPU|nr:tektin-2 isoform X1 [Ictalurus punctatus]XP_017336311.1 tektin-2 isoform X1 [Ictalurus punctatus]
MATLSIKPGLRCTVSDWMNTNNEISVTAEQRRHLSHEIRQEGRALCNDTTNKTIWGEYDNNRRLSDRISEVKLWKKSLEACAEEVDTEMDALTLTKEAVERALAATVLPLEVTNECLTLREGRRGNELLSDPVEAELKKEVEVIDKAQEVLQQCIDQAFRHLCLLQEARHQLTLDLQHKMQALDVDISCLSLSVTSSEISLKPNPTRVPPGSTTPQQWVQFSQNNITQAKEEMQASLHLRENINITIAEVQNELESQRIATRFAFRKRTHQLEQAHQELQWQIKTVNCLYQCPSHPCLTDSFNSSRSGSICPVRQTQDEINELKEDILRLERDMQSKMAPLKLVHTRLEYRTRRPGTDLCRDEVQHGLVEETRQLASSILVLKQKLAQAQDSLQALQLHEARMLEDLVRKQEALSLEQRSMQTRQRLNSAQKESEPSAVSPLTNSSGMHKLQLKYTDSA